MHTSLTTRAMSWLVRHGWRHSFILVLWGGMLGAAQAQSTNVTSPNAAYDILTATGGFGVGDTLNVTINLKEAVVASAITRAQPIVLTGLAAMMGAFFILDDPIFNGLAISLISGIFVSTALTLLVIPLLYFMAFKNKPASLISGEHA